MSAAHRRLAAIMFTDLVGYSSLAQRDEARALSVLDRHNRTLRGIFPKFGGREVKTIGDAFLVEFDSALEAVRCALEVQTTLHGEGVREGGDWRIRIRVGIHVGDVVPTDGDLLGDAVNIASRIEPLAEPEGIRITQQVFDQVMNKIDAPLVRLPPVELKNIQNPVTVYRVVPPWEAPTASPPLPRRTHERQLAVLPLANISPDPNDEYFADGLTEELISALSQVRGLGVIARTSVAPYKAATKSVAQIGSELGVDTVLEGSVRKADRRIRISLQLVDVATQRHVWASSYNREIGDVFAVQTDIAERTAEALRLELGTRARDSAERRPTANPAAYDLYLKGLVATSESVERGIDEAVRCFAGATELDPKFAEAYAAWADLLVTASGDCLPMREVMPRAKELAARAIELDADSSDAHAALGNIALQFDHDWARAESEFRRAIELNPSNASVHRFYGLLLIALERFDEAKEVIRSAIRLDPGGGHWSMLAWAELEAGNLDAAVRYAELERDRDPRSIGNRNYAGLVFVQAGRRTEALREAETPMEGANETERFDRALLNALLGRPESAREVAAEVERGTSRSYTSAGHLAMLYGALGEYPRALDLLEKDYREGDQMLWLFYRGVFFDAVRGDPRFLALLRQYDVPIHAIRGWSPPAGSTGDRKGAPA